MDLIHVVLLGIVQGVAEFLPISSSGHLVICESLMRDVFDVKLPESGKTLSVALHAGTLASILVVYRDDLLPLLRNRKLILTIILATIPVGIVGLMFKDFLEKLFQSPLAAGCCLIVTAIFLFAAWRLQRSQGLRGEPGFGLAIMIGLFQAIAILPGISRSGSTISAGLLGGLSRTAAARFSFLIAIPAIGGATVVELKDVFESTEGAGSGSVVALCVGAITSFVVGVAALKWLLTIVAKDRLHWFAGYCLVVGIATIIWRIAVQ